MAGTGNLAANMSALSVSTGSGLANIVADENTKKLLECPVCLEIAMPPIYTCQTGHIICNDCKNKLKECALCKLPYTTSRNFPLESLVQSARFYCNHRHRGCRASASMDALKNHHLNCAMRPVKCHLSTLNQCDGALHYLSDYAYHLQKVHKLPAENVNSKITSLLSISDENDCLETSYTWSGRLYIYDGRVFVTLMRNRGLFFHFGLFLIGNATDAAKYRVKISLSKKTGNCVNKYEITTSVPSVRNFQEEGANDDPNLPSTAVVHKSFLESVGEVEVPPIKGPSKLELRWATFYEIIKL